MRIMLMRSPVHPSLMRWALREEPTGRRRLALAYLTAAVGAVTSLVIIGITLVLTRQCQATEGAEPGCLAGFFHGLCLSIIGGLVVTSGLAAFIKLGLRYVAGLLAFAAPVLLIAQLLSILGTESGQYVLAALVGVPAAASWLSARLRTTPASRPALAPDRAARVAEPDRSDLSPRLRPHLSPTAHKVKV